MAQVSLGVCGTLVPFHPLDHAALREPQNFPAVRAKEHTVFPRNERNTTGLGINLRQLLATMTAKWREVITFDDGQ